MDSKFESIPTSDLDALLDTASLPSPELHSKFMQFCSKHNVDAVDIFSRFVAANKQDLVARSFAGYGKGGPKVKHLGGKTWSLSYEAIVARFDGSVFLSYDFLKRLVDFSERGVSWDDATRAIEAAAKARINKFKGQTRRSWQPADVRDAMEAYTLQNDTKRGRKRNRERSSLDDPETHENSHRFYDTKANRSMSRQWSLQKSDVAEFDDNRNYEAQPSPSVPSGQHEKEAQSRFPRKEKFRENQCEDPRSRDLAIDRKNDHKDPRPMSSSAPILNTQELDHDDTSTQLPPRPTLNSSIWTSPEQSSPTSGPEMSHIEISSNGTFFGSDVDQDSTSQMHGSIQAMVKQLLPGNWLGHGAMHHILGLMITSGCRSVEIANSQSITDWDGWALARQSQSPRLVDSHTILVPLLRCKHWSLLHFDCVNRVGRSYNSKQEMLDPQTMDILKAIVRVYTRQEVSEWQFVLKNKVPPQINQDDCGIHTLVTALHVIAGISVPLQYDCRLWRTLFSATLREDRIQVAEIEQLYSMVGVSDFDLCELTINAVLDMPETIERLYEQMDAAERALGAISMLYAKNDSELKLLFEKQEELRRLEEKLCQALFDQHDSYDVADQRWSSLKRGQKAVEEQRELHHSRKNALSVMQGSGDVIVRELRRLVQKRDATMCSWINRVRAAVQQYADSSRWSGGPVTICGDIVG